jgi:hypothetical protein
MRGSSHVAYGRRPLVAGVNTSHSSTSTAVHDEAFRARLRRETDDLPAGTPRGVTGLAVRKQHPMPRLSYCLCLALVAGLVLDASSVQAAPETRDHRAAPAPAEHASIGRRRRPGPRFMMPLKVDIGASGANTVRGFAPGIGMAIGIHWASLSPRPTHTDVGLGVFGALLSAPADTSAMNDSNGVAYGGAYLEVGHTLAQGSFWRTWASGRGEYVASSAFGERNTGFGAAARLSAELYVSGVGIESRGVFLGTYALGVYVEAGARDMAQGVGVFQASGGLTFRTPLVFAP